MENQPQNIIAIGRKRFPIEEIALVELFEPPAEQRPPRFTSDKDFKARVISPVSNGAIRTALPDQSGCGRKIAVRRAG